MQLLLSLTQLPQQNPRLIPPKEILRNFRCPQHRTHICQRGRLIGVLVVAFKLQVPLDLWKSPVDALEVKVVEVMCVGLVREVCDVGGIG